MPREGFIERTSPAMQASVRGATADLARLSRSASRYEDLYRVIRKTMPSRRIIPPSTISGAPWWPIVARQASSICGILGE
jgi:hypothetical protein